MPKRGASNTTKGWIYLSIGALMFLVLVGLTGGWRECLLAFAMLVMLWFFTLGLKRIIEGMDD